MQPETRPSVNDLIKNREKVYVLCESMMEERGGVHITKVLRCCQNTVHSLCLRSDLLHTYLQSVNVKWHTFFVCKVGRIAEGSKSYQRITPKICTRKEC